jgi:hypothetical protein
LHDDEIILRVKFSDFDRSAALVQPKFPCRSGWAKSWLRSCCHRVSRRRPASEESPLYQSGGIQRLTRPQFGRSCCLGVDGLARDRDLAFDIIYTS